MTLEALFIDAVKPKLDKKDKSWLFLIYLSISLGFLFLTFSHNLNLFILFYVIPGEPKKMRFKKKMRVNKGS